MRTYRWRTAGRVPPIPKAFDPGVRPTLYELIDLHNRNRIDYNDRKWETVKFFQGIFSALIVATVAAVIAGELGQHVFDNLGVRLLIAAMPLLSAVALWSGLANLRRESRLLLLDEYQIFKLARLAGLDVELQPEQRWLANDPYLLLDAWRDSRCGSEGFVAKTPTEWVDARLKNHKFLRLIRGLFAFEGLLAILIAALIVRWTLFAGWLATLGW